MNPTSTWADNATRVDNTPTPSTDTDNTPDPYPTTTRRVTPRSEGTALEVATHAKVSAPEVVPRRHPIEVGRRVHRP